MANRNHMPIAVIENDMAVLAKGKMATEDLEGLLLRFSQKPIVILDDIDRFYDDLYDIKASHAVIGKYLTDMRSKEES